MTLDEFLSQNAEAAPTPQPSGQPSSAPPTEVKQAGSQLDNFLTSHGVDINALTPGQARQPTDMETSAGYGLMQGASMPGSKEIGAALAAIPSTETDRQLGRSYADRLQNSYGEIKDQFAQAKASHPYVSAIAEIASSIPKTIGLTGGLSSLGVTGVTGNSAIQGGLEGLNRSKKESIAQTALDTTIGAGVSAAAAGSLQKLGSAIKTGADEAGVSLTSAVNEFGDPIRASIAPKVSKAADDILKIDYGIGSKEAFKLGQEMQATLTNPKVKAQITDEVINQPKQVQGIIDNLRQPLGQKYDQTVDAYKDVTGDLTSVFVKAKKAAESIFDKSDVSVEKAKTALLGVIDEREKSLATQYGSLKEVPLDQMSALKQDLGNLIFQQKAFKKAGTEAVHGQAVKFWGNLTDTIAAVDKEKASGGTLAQIDKVFRGLYEMEDTMPSGAQLLSLANPKGASAREVFDNFLASWAKVPADARALYGQQLTDYLQKDFAKALAKGQLMQAVDQGASPGIKTLGVYLPGRIGRMNIANKLGAFYGPSPQGSIPLDSLNQGVNKAQQLLAPGLAGQVVSQQQGE
jgi:hypothetical protein